MSRFDPLNLMRIRVDDYTEIPELPQGVIDRLAAVMSLWHTDPWKASWYIDPKLAEKMWGPSRSGRSAEPAISSKVESGIRDMWLNDPERAIRYVKPTEAIKRYGRPPGVDATRLVELHKLYLTVQSRVGTGTPEFDRDLENTFEIYSEIHKNSATDGAGEGRKFLPLVGEDPDAGKD